MIESVGNGTLSVRPAVQPPSYGFWRTIGVGTVIYVLSLYLATLATAFLGAAACTLGGAYLDGLSLLAGPASPYWMFGASLRGCLQMLMVYIVIWELGFSSRAYFETRPFSLRQLVRTALAFAGIVILLQIMYVTLSHFLDETVISSSDVNGMWRQRLSVLPVLGLLVSVLLAPAAEEIFFRGFLYTGMAKSFAGPYAAIVLTAGLWAATHWKYTPVEILLIFLLGTFLGWIRYRSSSLVPPIMIHGLFNLYILLPLALTY